MKARLPYHLFACRKVIKIYIIVLSIGKCIIKWILA